MKKRKYDLIFSMGAACSCTSMLRAAELQVASFPFDWLFGSDFDGRADIAISEFKRFIDKKDLEYAFSERSIHCDAYHNKYNDLTFNHDFEKDKDLSETYPAVREKYNRRIKRLLSKIEISNKILIVYIETPDVLKTLSDTKIKNAFKKIQKHWPDKKIDLIYLSPDISITGIKEYVLSDNITRFVGNYKSKDVNDVSYAVDNKMLKNFFKSRYVLKKTLGIYIKHIMIKNIIKFIPSHKIRVGLRKKYHLA